MSKILNMPESTPGGMEAHVHVVPVPEVDDRVILGPITIPMGEFCALVRHVLTDGPLHDKDKRVALVDAVRAGTFGAPAKAPIGRGGTPVERRQFEMP